MIGVVDKRFRRNRCELEGTKAAAARFCMDDSFRLYSVHTMRSIMLSFALNFKGLKYKTEWVEYPDIKGVCKDRGARPTTVKSDGVTPHYTLPVIFDPATKTVLEDSTAIAEYLDKTYPDLPRLYPAGTRGLQAAFESAIASTCSTPLYQIVVLATWANLPPRSQEYFRRTREASSGKRLEDFLPEGDAGEQKWKDLESGMAKVAGWFKASGDKPFLGGDVPLYADFQLAARFIWAKMVLGTDSTIWKRIAALDDGRWDRYLNQFDKWATVV